MGKMIQGRIFKGKKAVFFTLIAILIITMFILYFKMQSDIPLKSKAAVAGSRVTSMNDFIRSFETIYAPRALYATSHRALGSITTYITWKNDPNSLLYSNVGGDKFFISNITKAFQTAVNGSRIYDAKIGNYYELPEMKDKNISFWFQKLAEVAKKEMGMDLQVNITNLYLEQDYETGPWKARAVMELEYAVNTTGVASWRREMKGENAVKVEFDVAGFIDPYLAGMTNGTLNRTITLNKFNPREINGLAMFQDTINDGNYTFENYSAPSFLFRFEGNTSPSYCCGIESFVYPGEVYPDTLDPDKYGNSYLDFQFFRGRCYQEILDVDNHPQPDASTTLWLPEDIYPGSDYLKIDSYHRFKVYPNIGSAYLTIGEYNLKHKDEVGFVDVSIPTRCKATYDNYDGKPIVIP